MSATPPTILVADDDRSIRTVLTQALGRSGYQVRSTGTASMLWRWVEEGEGDLVITDVMMPDGNGLDLIPRIRRVRPELRIIVMSAQSTLMTAVKATQRGAFEYLPKPFDLTELLAVVGRAREGGLPGKLLDQGAIEVLQGHRWPGNVRELENLMHRLAALCPDEVVGAPAVQGELREIDYGGAPERPGEVDMVQEPLARAVERHILQFLAAHGDALGPSDIYDRVLAEVERPLIRMTLAATRGNQIKAAAMLGLNRNTLRKKIRDLDIPVIRGVA
jgi:DNA-binding NtrC family response regulator